MTDTPIRRLNVTIPKETYDAVMKITEAQNANINNNVARLLDRGIEATYEQWPNLREKVKGSAP